MKTSFDYRHRAAQLLRLYRWKCKFYGKQTIIPNYLRKHIYSCYMQICVLYEIGLISISCKTRAFYMYAKIRDKYYRGVKNGNNE